MTTLDELDVAVTAAQTGEQGEAAFRLLASYDASTRDGRTAAWHARMADLYLRCSARTSHMPTQGSPFFSVGLKYAAAHTALAAQRDAAKPLRYTGRMTAPSATFRVLDEVPRRAPRISTAEIEANLDKVRQHPGPWCVVATFANRSASSNRASRLQPDHPDLEISSRGNDLIARTREDTTTP